MAKTQKKTVKYRRFVLDRNLDGDGLPTLQGMLEKVMAMRQAEPPEIAAPIARLLSNDGSTRQALTWLTNRQKCVVGEVIYYTPKKKITLVDFPDGETWQGVAEPKDDNGNERNLQESPLVFAVRENHIAVITSRGFAVAEFQGFLVWLLQEACSLAEKHEIALQNLPAKSALAKVKDSKISSVKFGNQAFTKAKEEIPAEDRVGDKKRKKVQQVVHQNEKVAEILEILGMKIIGLSKHSDPGQISLEIKVSYRGSAEKAGANMVRNLAANLGDQDDFKTTISLSGGGKIENDELTITDTVTVMIIDENISSDDAWNKLAEWLLNAITTKRVFT